MKISLINTLLNEENNIDFFLNSIVKQTEKPDEFIIVDGGSKDKTYKIVKEFCKRYNWIKSFQLKGANISQGRNYAIKKTKNEVIAVCDAGGKYKEDWLEKLKKGFNGAVGFGIDKPLIKNNFQRILAEKILHKNVPGSSRNMIFLKKIWKGVGEYPEDLDRAEDTLFEERIKKKGYKIWRIRDAICYWEMRENLDEVQKQFYEYGYWDGILEKKYKLLPKKYKILVILLIIIFPLYPLFWIISRFSFGFKIDFVRRYAYLSGFLNGRFK